MTSPWLTACPIQAEVWLKMDQKTNIFTVLAQKKELAREGETAL